MIINKMKAKANEELEIKVRDRTAEIREQKQVVEKQKEEIVDSIKYAQRIQQSILPTDKEISKIKKVLVCSFIPLLLTQLQNRRFSRET